MKILGILGSGHLGQQIAHLAVSDKQFDSVVFFDDMTSEIRVMGFPVIGKKTDILESYKKQLFSELIIGIGYHHMNARKALFEEYSQLVPMATLVHSSSIVDCSAKIGSGSILYPGCVIDQNVQIGNNVLLNLSCTISHDSNIGSHSFFAPSVTIAGFVSTGEMNMLGVNTTVIDSIKLTEKVQTGGGTVVIKNIDEAGLYVGSPAKFIR